MDVLVPLDNSPNQSFDISLATAGVVFTLKVTLRYNETAHYWVMTIKDAAGNLLLDSIPFVTGDWPAANILGQHSYLNLGSAYVVNASNVALDYPDAATLGREFVLIWSDTAA